MLVGIERLALRLRARYLPFLKNSVAARRGQARRPRPACSRQPRSPRMTKSSASSASMARLGAKPPSSPTLVLWPASFSAFFSAWKTRRPCATPRAKLGAPTGMIMNSWKSIGLSACAPPLMMFIIGTGRSVRLGPADIAVERQVASRRAAALATASDTPRMALAPSRALFGVPSSVDQALVDAAPGRRPPCRTTRRRSRR